MNEFDFIRQLREQTEWQIASTRVLTGIGDDAAVIRQSADRDLVITTDLLLEEIDFHHRSAPPRLLGHKSLAVSLSDIAAMGARPICSLVSLGLTESVWATDFKAEFFSGYLALADRYGVALVGGDVSKSEARTVIDSIVVGEVNARRATLRSTARPGDQIFVTGTLGGAAAGLKLLELGARVTQAAEGERGTSPTVREGSDSGSGHSSEEDAIQTLLLRQLRPQARVGWGIVLGEDHFATSMIDISDGLSSDLAHLCRESGVGAMIQSEAIPVDQNVIQLCGRRALDPLALALHGGEDFELLFTVAPKDLDRLPRRVDGTTISHIGEVTSESGTIRIREKNRQWELKPQGFQHFNGPSEANSL